MGLFSKIFGSSNSAKSNDSKADEVAANFVAAFRNHTGIEKLNEMAEDLVAFAQVYNDTGDLASYRKLLEAAKDTSYYYQGNKYPQALLEDLIRNIRYN